MNANEKGKEKEVNQNTTTDNSEQTTQATTDKDNQIFATSILASMGTSVDNVDFKAIMDHTVDGSVITILNGVHSIKRHLWIEGFTQLFTFGLDLMGLEGAERLARKTGNVIHVLNLAYTVSYTIRDIKIVCKNPEQAQMFREALIETFRKSKESAIKGWKDSVDLFDDFCGLFD